MNLQLLLAKKEVAYGTDPVAVAANTVRCEDVTFELKGERDTPQTAKPGVGGEAAQTYGQHVMLGFKIPLIGSGVAGTAPKWGPILKACGYAETVVAATSVTYAPMVNPLLADSLSLTWRDGNRRTHLVKGWRGRVGFELNAGKRPMLVIAGLGLHTDVATAGAVLAHADADFTGWLNPLPVAQGTTTFSLGGVAGLGIREFSLDAADNVKFIDVPEQRNVELRGDRTLSGNLKTTVPLPSLLNYETKWRTGSVETFALVHGATAGQIVTLNGRTQLLDPKYSRDNDQDVVALGLNLVPSSLTTDDDISLVLT